MRVLLVIVFVGLYGSAPAQTNAGATKPDTTKLCSESERLIEYQLKTLARQTLSRDFADNSAPRETNRLLRDVTVQLAIQNQLTHMQMLGCPPLSFDVSYVLFVKEAAECALAEMKGLRAEAEEKCDLSKWNRPTAKPQ